MIYLSRLAKGLVIVQRKKCSRLGHRWMAWSPGSDWWCGRLGCKAKRKAPVMAFIEGALLRSVVDCEGLSNDRDLAEAIGDSTGIGDPIE